MTFGSSTPLHELIIIFVSKINSNIPRSINNLPRIFSIIFSFSNDVLSLLFRQFSIQSRSRRYSLRSSQRSSGFLFRRLSPSLLLLPSIRCGHFLQPPFNRSRIIFLRRSPFLLPKPLGHQIDIQRSASFIDPQYPRNIQCFGRRDHRLRYGWW